MHTVGQFPQPRHDLVLIYMEIAESGGAVWRDDRGPTHHRQADAALRLLLVVEAIPVLGHPVFGVRRLMRGTDHAVTQREVLQLERLQQRVDELAIHGHCLCHIKSWKSDKFASTSERRL